MPQHDSAPHPSDLDQQGRTGPARRLCRDMAPPASSLAIPAVDRRRSCRSHVESRFPEYSDIYRSYQLPIMRADFGRYFILKALAASMRTSTPKRLRRSMRCSDRLCLISRRNPHRTHSSSSCSGAASTGSCRMPSLRGPPGHPFWDHLLDILRRCRTATNSLDATGPFVLTAAIDSFPLAKKPLVLPAEVFSPFDKFEAPVPRSSEDIAILAHHHWMGSSQSRFAAIRSFGQIGV